MSALAQPSVPEAKRDSVLLASYLLGGGRGGGVPWEQCQTSYAQNSHQTCSTASSTPQKAPEETCSARLELCLILGVGKL